MTGTTSWHTREMRVGEMGEKDVREESSLKEGNFSAPSPAVA